ncbi:hypothetical protein [Planobacterium oryzisoli]|uniref:Uncharacterized protein n=1 Tax=Planobacterium oryzisoli TaxID=2771435 RepID=A0A930YV64_9FLAO|nr:hypothetical protein [Planobacterium oryzisoli]MBF5026950.1 hypothetical protein [Planobacterium oryzisoli]
MKQLLKVSLGLTLFTAAYLPAQSLVVVNEKLLFQLSKNQLARKASTTQFESSIKKQNALLESASKKAALVLYSHEVLYQKLYEVDALIKDSHQVLKIGKLLEDLGKSLGKLSRHSLDSPEYSLLLSRFYLHFYSESLLLKDLIAKEILSEDPKLLLTSYHRDLLLSKVVHRLQSLYNTSSYILSALEFSKKRPYLEQIPGLEDYINLDRELVRSILSKYQSITR